MEFRGRFMHFRRLTGMAAAIAMFVTVFAPAMAASQAPPTALPSFSTRSIAKVVSATTPAPARLNRATTDTATTAPKQPTKSGSFFKTRAGLLVIGVMAVGAGYAVYSAKEDRIRGSVR